MLTPERVATIHHEGGSILGAGRGGDLENAFAFFDKYGINQVRARASCGCCSGGHDWRDVEFNFTLCCHRCAWLRLPRLSGGEVTALLLAV